MFQFALFDPLEKKLIGTSLIIARHGLPEAPHIYLSVGTDERYSSTIDRHFEHTTLRLGFSYQGPTEVGALILHPQYRGLGLGKQLSLVRFAFIAARRSWFQPKIIAEMMPPLTEDGRSELWEYLGKKFTGLTYQEADKLSKANKEFISALFPQNRFYTSLFPKHVEALVGQVGPQSRGALKLLKSIGFKYSHQIDPFDGGPHYIANTDEITTIQNTQKAVFVDKKYISNSELTEPYLISTYDNTHFHAVISKAKVEYQKDGSASVYLKAEDKDRLRLSNNEELWITRWE